MGGISPGANIDAVGHPGNVVLEHFQSHVKLVVFTVQIDDDRVQEIDLTLKRRRGRGSARCRWESKKQVMRGSGYGEERGRRWEKSQGDGAMMQHR